MPFGGPCVRNLRAGQNSVKVTTVVAELRWLVTRVWHVPLTPRPPGPGMRQAVRVWWLGKMVNPFPQNDDCTRAIAGIAPSPKVEGTVPGIGGRLAWWLLAQADATSTTTRTRGVALKTFIGLRDTCRTRNCHSGSRDLAWGQRPLVRRLATSYGGRSGAAPPALGLLDSAALEPLWSTRRFLLSAPGQLLCSAGPGGSARCGPGSSWLCWACLNRRPMCWPMRLFWASWWRQAWV